MLRTFFIALSTVVLLSGCRDTGDPVRPVNISEPEILSRQFVVDSFAVDYGVKRNPNTDSLNAVFPFTLKYHFEGCSGSLNTFTLVAVGYERIVIYMGAAYPDSVGHPLTISDTLWARNQFESLDSIVIQCHVTGPFWTLTDHTPNFLDSFDWNTQVTIPVRGR